MRVALPYQDQAVRMGIRQRSKHDSLDHAEHGGSGADSQSQREHGNDREAGRFSQRAQAKTKVLKQSFHKVRSGSFVAFFLVALISAEFDSGSANRFCSRERWERRKRAESRERMSTRQSPKLFRSVLQLVSKRQAQMFPPYSACLLTTGWLYHYHHLDF